MYCALISCDLYVWLNLSVVLAVGKGDGSVLLHSVEDGRALHQFSAGATVVSLHWTQQSHERYLCSWYCSAKQQVSITVEVLV